MITPIKIKIKTITYDIVPINGFNEIKIYEENNKYYIGISFYNKFGKVGFVIFKNLIIPVFKFLIEKENLNSNLIFFDTFNECEEYIQKLNIDNFNEIK